jgi:hypothetical protein
MVEIGIEYLKQWDARWKDIKMGDSQLTLGRWGCLTTDLAVVTDSFGCKMTPAQIAQNKKNYDLGGNIKWTSLDFPTFSFRWEEGNQFTKNPNAVDKEMLKAWLTPNLDRACIMEVANGTHWVLGLWFNAYDNDFLAMDPMTGATCLVNKTYGAITEAALFVRWDKTKNGGKQAWQGQGKPVAPLYN